MKIIHLSDLHIGKRVNEFSMIDDQKYILTKIINIVDDQKPQAVIIAGDIYDKSVPSSDAVEVFDWFLNKLSSRKLSVLIISGNHDNAQRIAFGNQIFDNSGIYISPVFDGNVKKVKLRDDFGNVNFYLLPFVKPSNVRGYYPDSQINSYNDAIKTIVDNIVVDTNSRNILVTHQFVTGAISCDSEELSVGGTDNVDCNLFNDFDYVALGHIHGPQKIIKDTVRYCGTPLKYSFSECYHKKSVTVVEIDGNKNVDITTVPLIPKHDMREIKGKYMDIMSKEFYTDTNTNDYIHITLTDEEDVVDALAKLRIVYPNIMKLDYDNKRTKSQNTINSDNEVENKTPLQLFCDLYELQNNQSMSNEQVDYLTNIMDKMWEEEV